MTNIVNLCKIITYRKEYDCIAVNDFDPDMADWLKHQSRIPSNNIFDLSGETVEKYWDELVCIGTDGLKCWQYITDENVKEFGNEYQKYWYEAFKELEKLDCKLTFMHLYFNKQ